MYLQEPKKDTKYPEIIAVSQTDTKARNVQNRSVRPANLTLAVFGYHILQREMYLTVLGSEADLNSWLRFVDVKPSGMRSEVKVLCQSQLSIKCLHVLKICKSYIAHKSH
jgi:hypothetical protein